MDGSASRKMLPPSPPSPPSGPPRGTNFSRRKLTQPAPPSPPLTKTSISSTNMPCTAGPGGPRRRSHRVGADAHEARITTPLELHEAVHLREQRVVRADPDVQSGLEPRPALADEDGAARHELAGESLHAEHLGIRVPAVPRAADALLVSHRVLDLDLRDSDRRRRLAVAAVPAIVLPPLELHDPHLPATALGHDFAGDLGATEGLLARDDLAITVDEQDGLELDRRALFTRQ